MGVRGGGGGGVEGAGLDCIMGAPGLALLDAMVMLPLRAHEDKEIAQRLRWKYGVARAIACYREIWDDAEANPGGDGRTRC